MPQLTFPVISAGLAVPVLVGLPGGTTTGLVAAGQPIPPPVQARALVDTGSNVTAVAPWVLHQLAVPAATKTSTHTAGGLVKVKLYKVSVSITDPGRPGSPMLTEPDLLVMELTTALPDTDVLIGLDLLLGCRLLLDGPARRFTLDF
jgi:predicted aspartyl protease